MHNSPKILLQVLIYASIYNQDPARRRADSTVITYSKIKEERKRQNMENNLKRYANYSIGIHEREYPKFANSIVKEYWKTRNYVEAPSFSSHQELTSQKNYSPLHTIHYDDIPYKLDKQHVPLPKSKEVTDKINSIRILPDLEERKNVKFKGKEMSVIGDTWKKQSQYEIPPDQRESYIRETNEPLYSSFIASIQHKHNNSMQYKENSPGNLSGKVLECSHHIKTSAFS